MKKTSLLLCAALLCALAFLLPTRTQAAQEGDYSYSVTDGKATIYDYRLSYEKDIVIPSTLGGYPVTEISDSAFRNTLYLKTVVIPEGVTTIGPNAFYGCALTSVTIPDSVTYVGRSAFSGLMAEAYNTYHNAKYLGNEDNPYLVLVEPTETDITTCKVHANTKCVTDQVFSKCTLLTAIQVESGNLYYYSDASGVLFNRDKTELIAAPMGLSGKYTIPETVTSICDYAFKGCTEMTGLSVPSGINSLGSMALSGCSGLSYNTYDNAQYLGNSQNPYVVLVQATSKSITSCTIHPNTKVIYEYAFSSSKLTSVVIPDKVVTIGCGAFSYSKLSNVTIGSMVRRIEDSVFCGCMVTEVTIPDNVTDIGRWAFSECDKLETVNIGSGVNFLDSGMFDMSRAVTGYWVDGDNPYYSNDAAGVLFNKDKTELLLAPGAMSGTYTAPESVVIVGYRAFNSCRSLEGVVLAEKLEQIDDYAFANCRNLASVTMGDSVTYIGVKAFSSCEKLPTIDLPDSLMTIGYSAFEYCSGLTGTIRIPDGVVLIDSFLFEGCSGITAVVLGENVTEISNHVFYGCTGIATVYVPVSLTTIGTSAFENCSGIKTVYYGGSQSQWNSIGRKSGNNALLSGTIHFDHVHTTENPVEITAPHCRINGYGEYRCECADVRYGVIPATGHDYQQGVCTACGVQENGIPGDIDGNESVNIDDVVQLLLYVSMPDLFSIRTDGEFTNDGLITIDDVVQLLLHVSMPDLFPLQTEQ